MSSIRFADLNPARHDVQWDGAIAEDIEPLSRAMRGTITTSTSGGSLIPGPALDLVKADMRMWTRLETNKPELVLDTVFAFGESDIIDATYVHFVWVPKQ